jgi:hypothetical protein
MGIGEYKTFEAHDEALELELHKEKQNMSDLEFSLDRDIIVAAMRGYIAEKRYAEALELAQPFLSQKDPEFRRLLAEADKLLRRAQDKERLMEALQATPQHKKVKRYALLKRLQEIDPANLEYQREFNKLHVKTKVDSRGSFQDNASAFDYTLSASAVVLPGVLFFTALVVLTQSTAFAFSLFLLGLFFLPHVQDLLLEKTGHSVPLWARSTLLILASILSTILFFSFL